MTKTKFYMVAYTTWVQKMSGRTSDIRMGGPFKSREDCDHYLEYLDVDENVLDYRIEAFEL